MLRLIYYLFLGTVYMFNHLFFFNPFMYRLFSHTLHDLLFCFSCLTSHLSFVCCCFLYVYSHGNGCDLGMMYECMRTLRNLLHINVLAWEYPGYGCSLGTPSEESINAGMREVYSFVRQVFRWPSDRIVFFGQSLGTGPTCYLANILNSHGVGIGGIVLQSPYTCIVDVVDSFAGSLAAKLVPDRWRNVDQIAQVTAPTLLIHGEKDTLIPWHHSKSLYQASNSTQKHLIVVEKATHNDFNHYHDIVCPVYSFFKKYLRQNNSNNSIPRKAYGPVEIEHQYFFPPKGVAIAVKQRQKIEESRINREQFAANKKKEELRQQKLAAAAAAKRKISTTPTPPRSRPVTASRGARENKNSKNSSEEGGGFWSTIGGLLGFGEDEQDQSSRTNNTRTSARPMNNNNNNRPSRETERERDAYSSRPKRTERNNINSRINPNNPSSRVSPNYMPRSSRDRDRDRDRDTSRSQSKRGEQPQLQLPSRGPPSLPASARGGVSSGEATRGAIGSSSSSSSSGSNYNNNGREPKRGQQPLPARGPSPSYAYSNSKHDRDREREREKERRRRAPSVTRANLSSSSRSRDKR